MSRDWGCRGQKKPDSPGNGLSGQNRARRETCKGSVQERRPTTHEEASPGPPRLRVAMRGPTSSSRRTSGDSVAVALSTTPPTATSSDPDEDDPCPVCCCADT